MTNSAVLGLRRRGGPCRVVAHRGYSAAFPENTIKAYDAAISAGADLVEIDLRLSGDGEIVCHHDPATGGREIAALRTGELAAGGIERLGDVLPRLYGRVGLLFDLKRPEVGLAADALSLLRRHRMTGQTVVGVRSIEQVRFIRPTSPDSVILGFLKDYDAFPAFFEAGGDIARLWEEDCRPDLLDAARCGDHPVWVTAGQRSAGEAPGAIDAQRLKRLFAMNIDGILVNDPVLAVRARNGGSGAA
jgi:glycerophosphoryl diester phosphodiesterase